MTVDLFVLVAFGLLYFCWFLSYYLPSKKVFVSILITLLVFHDFIFINVGYYASEATTYVAKSWEEYLLIFLVLHCLWMRKLKLEKPSRSIIIGIIFLTVWGCAISLVRKTELIEIYLGWRSYLLPLLLFSLLYVSRAFDNLSSSFLVTIIVLIGFICALGVFYQVAVFADWDLNITADAVNSLEERERILRKFWFFEKFGAMHMLRSWPNYFRDANVRATSFFVSPITLAEFLVVPIVVLFTKIKFSHGGLSKIFYWTVFLVLVTATYLSNARIGMMLMVIALIISSIFFRKKLSIGVLLTILSFLIALVFVSLVVWKIGDDSAQGRLVQYAMMFQNFSFAGYGFGSDFSMIYFDSMYISTIMLFGIASIAFLLIHLRIMQEIYSRAALLDKMLVITSLTLVISFSFAFAFQYSVGSCTIPMAYLVCFFTLSKGHAKPPYGN